MSNKQTPINEGYQPTVDATKGYQPTKPASGTSDTGRVHYGYQPPTTSEGGGPTNPPPNKK